MIHRLLLIAAVLPLLAACAAVPHYEDPIPVMLDRGQEVRRRMGAARQAASELRADSRHVEALHELLWSHRQPVELRTYAVDELVRLNEAGFKRNLAKNIAALDNWDTLEHIFGLAVERQWRDVTPTVVRNYARKAHGLADRDRPERRVLEQLNPGKPVEAIVFDVFADADDSVPYAQQAAAWELLCRITGRGRLMAMLDATSSKSMLVADL